MNFKEILQRLESLLSSPYFMFPFQTVVTILLLVLTNILIQNPDIQVVAELGLVAFYVFATWQTFGLKADFRRYITADLLSELASSQGRIIKHVVVNKDFEELHPGDEYVVEFVIEGKQLIQTPAPKMLTPVLRMEPPVFQGDRDGSNEQYSVWQGESIACNPKADGTWELRGCVEFNTCRIGTAAELSSSITLVLSFRGEEGLLLDLELEHIPVHLMTRHQVFQELIRLEVLKKLPPGYNVLTISSDPEFCTNLVFLSRRLYELGSEESTDEQVRDRVRGLLASMSRFVDEEFKKNQNPLKQLHLAAYRPHDRETDLNLSLLLTNVLGTIDRPRPGRSMGNVWVAVYQTREFVEHIEREGASGICLFGFSQVAPPSARIVFDLSQLELGQNETGNPCHVDWPGLMRISESSEEYFEMYAAELMSNLAQKQRGIGSQAGVYFPSDKPEKTGSELRETLYLMQRPANSCLKRGQFVTSEPAITSYWVNLRTFEDELCRTGCESALAQAITFVTDRCIQAYDIDEERLCILNLCSEHSGIADELQILWEFEHRIPTYPIGIDRKTLPEKVTDISSPMYVVLLTPVDSYVATMETVLQRIKEGNNHVVCIISLFSVAKTWDYLGASECFDIIPLFRVDPNFPSALVALTRMADYQRIKPWLLDLGDVRTREEDCDVA